MPCICYDVSPEGGETGREAQVWGRGEERVNPGNPPMQVVAVANARDLVGGGAWTGGK